MTKTATVLLVKLLMTFVFAWVSFGLLGGNAWRWVFAVAVAGTVVNYLVGDLVVLPVAGNFLASLVDGGLGALTAFGVRFIVKTFVPTSTGLITFGVLIALGEYFFHQSLLRSRKVAP